MRGGGGGGGRNLDILLNLIEEQDKLKDVLTLGNVFIEDVQDRMEQMDIQYLTRLKKSFTVYMDTVNHTEPAKIAGTRRMHVQPTAIFRRREGHQGKQNGTKWQTTQTYSHAVSRLI